MQRVTITVDDELAAEIDRFMAARSYANRSEAIRDLARAGMQQVAVEVPGPKPCVAALVYVYDHEARELPKRLARDFHDRHDLAQATLHVHLDHELLSRSHGAQGPRFRRAGIRRPHHLRARRTPRPRRLHAGGKRAHPWPRRDAQP